nr:RNA-directed DNA polymerase, eukaryota, reverse transcriptase zinc-binding domain protein [Tanacetum cinerariifolium]
MSKLDHFLLSPGILDRLPGLTALVLEKKEPNHRPILLRENMLDYGAYPFRTFHSWFHLEGFDDLVIKSTWLQQADFGSRSMSKAKKRQVMVFKVNFEKAYDSVSWDYLFEVMGFMGFRDRWCSWIRGLLCSVRASILVNGSPTKEFIVERVLCQGDLLSPFLFILIMEGLHIAFKRARELKAFTGFRIGGGEMAVSHFFYVDDAVFLCDWSLENVRRIFSVSLRAWVKVLIFFVGWRAAVNENGPFRRSETVLNPKTPFVAKTKLLESFIQEIPPNRISLKLRTMAGGNKQMGLLVLCLMLLFMGTSTVVVEGQICCDDRIHYCCKEANMPPATAMTPMSAFTGNKKVLGRKAYSVIPSNTHR